MASSFVADLQAQPWFAKVAAIFSQAKVPTALWESTVAVEDASLNPNAANYGTAKNPESSHGLFQVNVYGSLATPARVTAAYGTPEQNAAFAAAKMAGALAGVPAGTSLPDKLRAIEQAGWPGNLSEDALRQQALTKITGVGPGESPATVGGVERALGRIPGTIGGDVGSAAANATGLSGVAGSLDALNTSAGHWVFDLAAGALFLAIVAGGFAIMSSGGGGGGTRIVPVPV